MTDDDLGPSQRLALAAVRRGLPVAALVTDESALETDHAELVAMAIRHYARAGTSDPLVVFRTEQWLLEPPKEGRRYTHPCPLCGTPVEHADRYPRAVCHVCRPRTVDSTGRRIRGYNVSFSGGFVAHYADTADGVTELCDEVTQSGRCWIDGVECSIGEAHMGGTVVQRSAPA